jgi:transposase
MNPKMHSHEFKKAVLLVYDYLGSMRKAEKVLRVSSSTISRWSKQCGLPSWPLRGSKITEAMLAVMRLKLREFPSTSAAQLQQHLASEFGIAVSRPLVSLVLRTRLKYSWKRIRKRGPRGSGWSDDKIDAFKLQFLQAYNAGVLSSWDESSFDQRAHAIYGYAPLGHRAILNVPRNKCKHAHYSLLMGMHMNGSHHARVLEGSVKSPNFAEIVASAPFPPGSVMLLDNHSMHKTALVREAAARKHYTLLYTPPYSPEFNPIEMVFGITKSIFYKLRYTDDFGDDMPSCVDRCLDEVSSRSISGCFRHVKGIVDGTGKRA